MPSPTVFGLLNRRHVYRERPEFQVLGGHLRHLVLNHTVIDLQAVALLLLFAWSLTLGSGSGARAAQRGIHQFFRPDEQAHVRATMRALRRGDPAIAARIGPDRFEALRSIARAGVQLRQDQSSASA